MRQDHKPYWLKKFAGAVSNWYFKRYVAPSFDHIGEGWAALAPRSLYVHGKNITAGRYLHAIADKHKPIKITTWQDKTHIGSIAIGDYCLLSPGVEITAARGITIGDNCMLAAEVSIQDSDWHGLYNRLRPFRCTAAVVLGDNVWVGARASILKGVTIGDNAVIGAGAVVTRDVPANCVAAGNPAKIVKTLNPKRKFLKREYLFRHGKDYWQSQDEISAFFTLENSIWHWLRVKIMPRQDD